MNIFVGGSSGFIGGHLVKRLKDEGHFVIGADLVEPPYNKPDVFHQCDLRNPVVTHEIFMHHKIDHVYNLACLMGGMGYIGNPEHSFDVMVGSSQIVINVLDSAIRTGVKKIFYSSSACVYNENLQKESYGNVHGLKESDAYPSSPDLVYGWQKLFSEQLHQAAKDKIQIRIARFHNIYGPEGTWHGGKEKAPAAIARKIAHTSDHCNIGNGRGIGTIEVWADGEQTRSFLYIDDCIDAVRLLMESDHTEPINIGSEELVSINELVKITARVANKVIRTKHDLTKPQGVRGRNSNNELVEKVLGWKPKYSLHQGMTVLYPWIKSQIDGIQK